MFWRHRRSVTDFTAEIHAHLELEADRLAESGMSREEALAAARRAFGNVTHAQERVYEAGRWAWLAGAAGDVRLAFRRLGREPRFTAAALASLAICIGANVTIFAVVDAILLRPLPFSAPDRLVRIFNAYPAAGIESDASSFTNYYERRGAMAAFTDLAIYRAGEAVVGEAGATERVDVMRVSPDFLGTLGVELAMGRTFTDEEMTFQTDGVAMLTDGYWREHFGADAGVLGRDVTVDGARKRVVGVLPPRFRFLSSTARLYLPLSSPLEIRGSDRRYDGSVAEMIARLRPGVSLAAAQEQLDAHSAAVEAARPFPQFARMTAMGFRAVVVSLHRDHVRLVRQPLLLLQGGVLFLLLIGGVNLVNLLLVRASARAKEFAVRQALGAGWGRVARQVALETVVLVVSGGILGLLVSVAGVGLLTGLGARQLPLGAMVALDSRVVLLAIVGSAVIGAGLAVPLVWFSLRRLPAGGLRLESRGGTAGPAAQRVRHAFIVAQIALALVLLSGAALLSLSLARVRHVAPGFESGQLLTARLALPFNAYPTTAASLAFVERLLPALQQQPGVEAVAVSTALPFGSPAVAGSVSIEGVTDAEGPRRAHHVYGVIGPYWTAMAIPLREGRLLDNPREPRVCVVDEDFARRHWPGESAVGRRISYGPVFDPARADMIVGVVGAIKQNDLADTNALGTVYYPYTTLNARGLSLVVRSAAGTQGLASGLRAAVRQLDPALPLDDVTPMQTRIEATLITRRSSAILAAIVAGVAVLLVGVGTYGVFAYTVAQRRREVGVRVALGASSWQVLAQYLHLGGRLLVAGIGLGTFGAWSAGRAMTTILFQVEPLHVPVMAAAAGMISVVVFLAALLPSWRAARLSPAAALSRE